jgi:hypothetical protein
MLGLNMRKIKGTPYKLVLSGWNIVGIFDRSKFFSKSGMSIEHRRAADIWHASTFSERIANPRGA